MKQRFYRSCAMLMITFMVALNCPIVAVGADVEVPVIDIEIIHDPVEKAAAGKRIMQETGLFANTVPAPQDLDFKEARDFTLAIEDYHISLEAKDASIKEIVTTLAGKLEFELATTISEKEIITIKFEKLEMVEALKRFSNHVNMSVIYDSNKPDAKILKLTVLPKQGGAAESIAGNEKSPFAAEPAPITNPPESYKKKDKDITRDTLFVPGQVVVSFNSISGVKAYRSMAFALANEVNAMVVRQYSNLAVLDFGADVDVTALAKEILVKSGVYDAQPNYVYWIPESENALGTNLVKKAYSITAQNGVETHFFE